MDDIPGYFHSDLPENIKILDLIGQGQFSEVRKAINADLVNIAVKCISLEEIKKQPRLVSREVEILKRTSHPNIVHYYGCYKDSEYFYVTMELCERGNLREAIDVIGRLEESVMRPIAREILSALSYLHSMGIVHRDIKPENILFTSSNHVKLADFGLSRILLNHKQLTVVGTPYFIAPEMLAGKYSDQCDMWSIGIVFYFAMVGKMPFNAENIDQLFGIIRTEEIGDWGTLTEECIDFLKQLTRKSPIERMNARTALEHPWLAQKQQPD